MKRKLPMPPEPDFDELDIGLEKIGVQVGPVSKATHPGGLPHWIYQRWKPHLPPESWPSFVAAAVRSQPVLIAYARGEASWRQVCSEIARQLGADIG